MIWFTAAQWLWMAGTEKKACSRGILRISTMGGPHSPRPIPLLNAVHLASQPSSQLTAISHPSITTTRWSHIKRALQCGQCTLRWCMISWGLLEPRIPRKCKRQIKGWTFNLVCFDKCSLWEHYAVLFGLTRHYAFLITQHPSCI